MILLSLHPGPPSETSAFRRMRAFRSRRAGALPLRTSACSCSRSSALSRTTYFFTAMSFPAMIPSAARIAARANHPILSNWLKLTTRKVLTSRDPEYRTKLDNIQRILSGLGHNEGFFSIDEYGPFAVKHRGGRLLVAPGEIATVPQW